MHKKIIITIVGILLFSFLLSSADKVRLEEAQKKLEGYYKELCKFTVKCEKEIKNVTSADEYVNAIGAYLKGIADKMMPMFKEIYEKYPEIKTKAAFTEDAEDAQTIAESLFQRLLKTMANKSQQVKHGYTKKHKDLLTQMAPLIPKAQMIYNRPAFKEDKKQEKKK